MRHNKIIGLLVGSVLVSTSLNVIAEEDMQVSGFLRAAGAITTSDTPYLEGIDKNGSTAGTHFGLNVSRHLNDNLKVSGQIFASGEESSGFQMVLDWAFATLTVAEGLDVMLGKIKYPNMIVSDYVDIGIAYPWSHPPLEVYNFDAGGRPNTSLEAFVGGSVLYQSYFGDYDYSVQAYAGEESLETGGTLSKMMGAKLVIGNDIFSLHSGYNRHTPEGTTTESGALAAKNNNIVSSLSLGLKADIENAVIYSEYVKGTVDGNAALDTTGMYVTLGYHFGSLLPNITYATLDAEEGNSAITAGIKYQMTSSSTAKLDISQITPDTVDGVEAKSFDVIRVAYDVVF